MSAFTGPFSCATYSSTMGTSCCSGSMTPTSGGPGLGASSFFSQPTSSSAPRNKLTTTATRQSWRRVWYERWYFLPPADDISGQTNSDPFRIDKLLLLAQGE